MFPIVKGTTQQYLADLERAQLQLQTAQSQISSGLRVQKPSDDPAAIAEILQTQADIARNHQITTNLGTVKTEVSTADSVLQTAIQAVENAVSLASQGATSTATPEARANLAQQVSALQQTLVGISQTAVNGRYIFSGDQDSKPSYQLDPSQPSGVLQLITGGATRVIQSVDGTSFAVAKTAQDIFDARNPDNSVAAGNVFAAVQALLTGLNNNDTAAIAVASDSLKAAGTHLNSQLAFYGAVENQVQGATDLAQKFQTQQTTELSQVRDADITTAAINLTRLQTQQQASLSVEASVSQMKNLFSFLA